MTADLRALRDDPFELLVRFEAQVRAAKLDIAAGQAQFWVGLGYRLGPDWLVSPRDEVREVITVPPLTRVPGARPWLLGLANVRGALLPVCDLRRLIEEERHTMTRNSRVLVYHSDRVPAGFLVDEVAGYRQFVPAEQRRELAEGAAAMRPYLLGAFVRDGQPWHALSLHKVVRGDAFKHAGW
ncbi:MAG: purine-binding chemotaxis protein CheW [Gammaproteobacteria bacterium]|nr:purine-binding chemotaxis protein CheW [Gammaproteobacteria bacterium]